MEWIEKLHDLLEEYRHQFKLMYHMKSNTKETMIEIRSNGNLVIRVTEEDYYYCYERAYEDLSLYIKTRTEKIDHVISEFKRLWKEEA